MEKEIRPAKALDILFQNREWIDGTPVASMDDSRLIECRNYAKSHLSYIWYWKQFLDIVDWELKVRHVNTGKFPDSYWDDPRVLEVHPQYH